MKRSTLDKFRENLRLQQTYNVLLRYGWDLLFDRWPLVEGIRSSMQQWVWQIPDDLAEVSTPVKMRMMLEELGPTYVKMGQIVSSQASTIPPDWEAELIKLQSSVPPFPSDQVREIIIEELGSPPEVLFATFEPEPFAAASTAQVHKATLHSGERVVVKVQRPNIYNQMKADMGIMQTAAAVATRRSEQLQAIDLVGMVEEFSSSVLAELNYLSEAYNGMRLAENMAGLPGVHIPTVYQNLTTSRVLTMEFIRGVKVSNVAAIEAAGIDRKELAIRALRALVKQLMIDGFFHADPHPGNVLVNLENGDVTFIDLGMVGELELQERFNLVQLLFAIQQKDVPGMAQIMYSLSTPFVPKVDDKAYYHDFERTVGRLMHSGVATPFGEVVSMTFSLLREHGLRLKPSLTMAVKAMMQAETMATTLYPEGGLVQEGSSMVREMAVKEITADRIIDAAKKQAVMSAREVLKNIPSLQEATISWLTQYQKGRFEVYVDTSGLAKEVTKINRLGRQIVIAVILVGMLIGSAIATAAIGATGTQGGIWDAIFRLAYLGYIFSMVVAGIIVLRLVWRWLKGYSADHD